MRTILSKLLGACAMFGCVSAASAQINPVPVPLPFPSFKWDQRYTPPRATFTSKVTACTQPQAAPQVALDDWLCTKPGPILRLGWWGWLRAPAQGQRPYYVAIYRENPNNPCQPLFPPIYSGCMVPDQVKLVSKSCETVPGTNNPLPIYYMSAKLNPPFTQNGTAAAPEHYFIQISEADQQSLQFGVEDFRWAGRRPIQVCPALQFPAAAGGFIQPILDRCDQQPDDLSFRLFSRTVTGTLTPTVKIPGAVTFRLYKPGQTNRGDEIEVVSWSWGASNPTVIDGENRFDVDFDSPDGTYVLEVHAPGALPRRSTIVLQEGTETDAGGVHVAVGDLNGDGFINTIDLTLFLGSFGQGS